MELPSGKGPQLPFAPPAPFRSVLLDVTLPMSLAAVWLALFHNASALLSDFHSELGDRDVRISKWRRQKGGHAKRTGGSPTWLAPLLPLLLHACLLTAGWWGCCVWLSGRRGLGAAPHLPHLALCRRQAAARAALHHAAQERAGPAAGIQHGCGCRWACCGGPQDVGQPPRLHSR